MLNTGARQAPDNKDLIVVGFTLRMSSLLDYCRHYNPLSLELDPIFAGLNTRFFVVFIQQYAA
jgi:hypothetical protein